MEPLFLIAALTALHLTVLAAIDVLSGAQRWRVKLVWLLVIVCLPLVGAIVYYTRAGQPPRRAAAKRIRRAP